MIDNCIEWWREGSARGFGLRLSQSVKGSDSWVDDPITRHIISLAISKEEKGENNLLWPLVLHIKGPYSILILPLVEPHHLKSYSRMCNRSDCGSAIGSDENLSSLLVDLPSITGYGKLYFYILDIIFSVCQAIHLIYWMWICITLHFFGFLCMDYGSWVCLNLYVTIKKVFIHMPSVLLFYFTEYASVQYITVMYLLELLLI